MTAKDAILQAIHQARTGDSSTVAVRHLASEIIGHDISPGRYWVMLEHLEETGWISIDEGTKPVPVRRGRPRHYVALRKPLPMKQFPAEIARIIETARLLAEGHRIYRIADTDAIWLVENKLAGYWSILAKNPIAHDEWCTVYVQSAWYLCHADAISITDAGRIGNENVNAQAHVITIHSDPLRELVERDQAEHALSLDEARDDAERERERERLPVSCCVCGHEFSAAKSIAMETGLNHGHGACPACKAFLHLTMNEDGVSMSSERWDDYLAKEA